MDESLPAKDLGLSNPLRLFFKSFSSRKGCSLKSVRLDNEPPPVSDLKAGESWVSQLWPRAYQPDAHCKAE